VTDGSAGQAHPERWTEHDSERFVDVGRFFVPDREAQIDVVCTLLEHVDRRAPLGRVLDLGCGEGVLCEAILTRFPRARVHGVDASAVMLRRAIARLAPFGERFQPVLAELGARDWRAAAQPASAVVSSLAVHHLDGPGKRSLFADVRRMLAPGGALVVADVMRPASEAGRLLAARQWDEAVRERTAGDAAAYEEFRTQGWNMYAAPEPDPVDKPSTLLEHLEWLQDAGFGQVDAYWMRAGHAIVGGFAK
jgi:tRNA (cmo5U34)-methyltransferase